MSDYSIAFISNEAVTRSYANEILTEKWLGNFKVASSINSKRLENFKIDFCLIDTSKNLEILKISVVDAVTNILKNKKIV